MISPNSVGLGVTAQIKVRCSFRCGWAGWEVPVRVPESFRSGFLGGGSRRSGVVVLEVLAWWFPV